MAKPRPDSPPRRPSSLLARCHVATIAALLQLPASSGRTQVLIDFDDRPAPDCAFSVAERIADQWAGLGVTFSAGAGARTGVIQDQAACTWPVGGHSPPNIVAYVAGLADLPLVMDFDPEVVRVSILATNWRGVDDITLTAYDAMGAEIGSDTISTLGMVGPLQMLEVVGAGIASAVITNTHFNDDVAFDDLRFLQAAMEACCFADGSCMDLEPGGCASQGGIAQGPGSDCVSADCPAAQACCFADGRCMDLEPTDCAMQGGTSQGMGSDCAGTACPAPEACCFADGSCMDLEPADCLMQGGIAQGAATDCAGTSCPPPPLPGWTPDGNSRAGLPLFVEKDAGGDLLLNWSLGCSPDATTYTVHLGSIGDWYGHEALLCDAGPAMTTATFAPGAGDRYLLVVPVTAIDEGSYGLDSFGTERPPSTGSTCVGSQVLGCP